jgi:hypothetical protein
MRSRVTATMGSLLCIAFTEACTLDHRALGEALDGGGDAQQEAGSGGQSGTGVHMIDSGMIDYTLDSAVVVEAGITPHDAGPCMHMDQLGNADCSLTLTSNSDFNRNSQGWAPENGALVRWVDFDVQSSKGSGALAVKNATQGDVDGTVGVSAAQCLEAGPGKTYELGTSVYIKKGQPFGEGQILVFFFDQPSCGGVAESQAYALSQVEATGKWSYMSGGVTIPAEVKSFSMRLQVEKPFRSDALEVLFDAVRVTAGP